MCNYNDYLLNNIEIVLDWHPHLKFESDLDFNVFSNGLTDLINKSINWEKYIEKIKGFSILQFKDLPTIKQ